MKLDFDKVMKLFPMPKARDIQVEAIKKTIAAYNNGAKYVVLEAPTGCHRAGTPVMMCDGSSVAVEDLDVGDDVMGWKGPQTVLSLARGRERMAEIQPVKGESFVVNLSHILTLVHTETDEVVDVKVSDYLEWSAYKKHCHKLFRAPVREFVARPGTLMVTSQVIRSQEDLPRLGPSLRPYVLGVLLGDGSLTERTPRVCKPDVELGPDLQQQAKDLGLQYHYNSERGEHSICGRVRGPAAGGPNRLARILAEEGLNVPSGQRFIPPSFLTASWANRLELLAGLMDTDGHMTSGGFDFISQSKDLAEGVVFLSRSVGLAAYMKVSEKYDQNGQGGLYWRVSISGDCSIIPCRIPRKKAPKRQQVKDVLRTGFTVTVLDEEEDYYGFSLDGDGRFLLGDFTVTHNTGKSPLAMTFGQAFNTSYVLTLTAQLQDQYLRDFQHLGLEVLKGRGKFTCRSLGQGSTCRDGKLMDMGCEGDVCPYLRARKEALAAPHTIANYHSFFFNVATQKKTKKGLVLPGSEDAATAMQRPLTVLDEAHAVEGFLLDQMGVSVDIAKLSMKVAPPPRDEFNAEPYFDYFEQELIPRFSEKLKNTPDPKAKEELSQLIGKLHFVLATKDDEWIPERRTLKSGQLDVNWFAMKPLYVKRYGYRLWGASPHQLLLSGTVLSAFQLVHNIGLDPDEGDHIELDSPFDPEKRPIYIGNLDMRKKAREESWPQAARIVDQILESHSKEKGLLLCPSNEMLKFLQKNVKPENAQRFIIAFGEDRELKYRQHLTGARPTVLAASGYWEGADLKGDAARFQILPAAPRPMFQGQIAVRAKKDDAWYRWMTWTKFLQGTGRGVRSEDDWCTTYVLDREMRRELKRKDSMIPGWVRKACHVEEEG